MGLSSPFPLLRQRKSCVRAVLGEIQLHWWDEGRRQCGGGLEELGKRLRSTKAVTQHRHDIRIQQHQENTVQLNAFLRHLKNTTSIVVARSRDLFHRHGKNKRGMIPSSKHAGGNDVVSVKVFGCQCKQRLTSTYQLSYTIVRHGCRHNPHCQSLSYKARTSAGRSNLHYRVLNNPFPFSRSPSSR